MLRFVAMEKDGLKVKVETDWLILKSILIEANYNVVKSTREGARTLDH
jgi:hypothetical protein